jgi:phospholipid N-methyltransferase
MLQFFLQFLKNPRSIGAVAPSGKFLARKMMEPIDFERAKCIVEFGPGTGAFTREIMKRKGKDTKLILIEQNQIFCNRLKERYKNQRGVYAVCDSAENVNKYLNDYAIGKVDYIISGLPFTSLPIAVTENIFSVTRKAIGEKGSFITFQYSLLKKKFFEKYFVISDYQMEIRNFPPAFVFVMNSESKMDR